MGPGLLRRLGAGPGARAAWRDPAGLLRARDPVDNIMRHATRKTIPPIALRVLPDRRSVPGVGVPPVAPPDRSSMRGHRAEGSPAVRVVRGTPRGLHRYGAQGRPPPGFQPVH